MRKINYPTNLNDLKSFEDNYFSIINKKDIQKINDHLDKITLLNKKIDFESLLKMPFDELIEIESKIKTYSDSLDVTTISGKKKIKTNDFSDLFNYKDNQPKIASFFMKQDYLRIQTCYYCGIDYINSFSDFDDYFNGIDFLNRAKFHELIKIKGIGDTTAQKIIDKREISSFKKINEVKLSQTIIDQINPINFNNGHNHFTLDHVIPQKTHKFFSLCLYNFVPSCYSCNSKFKKDLVFNIDARLKEISPTSKDYRLDEDFNFRLFYPNKLNNIKSNKDFILQKTIKKNRKQIEKYLKMFKISGRYVFHKNIILELIENKIKYPESKIKEASKLTGKSYNTIRKEIFGDELFNPSKSDLPLVKFKRDIAKKLKIKGVL